MLGKELIGMVTFSTVAMVMLEPKDAKVVLVSPRFQNKNK